MWSLAVLTGYFYLKTHKYFARAKNVGRNNEVVVLMRWSYGGVPL